MVFLICPRFRHARTRLRSIPPNFILFPVSVYRSGWRQTPGRKDVLGGELSGGIAAFTQNRFCAAPVRLCREFRQEAGTIRSAVRNTGNANAVALVCIWKKT